MEDILDEIKVLIQEGYKEVTLLGQNVNSYGKDMNLEGGFAYLLEEVAKLGVPTYSLYNFTSLGFLAMK